MCHPAGISELVTWLCLAFVSWEFCEFANSVRSSLFSDLDIYIKPIETALRLNLSVVPLLV